MAKKKSRVKVCDSLWAEAVKKKANYRCEFCGSDKLVQAHHVIPRTNYSTRYLTENGVALCYKHHFYWAHKDALDFANWFKTRRERDYDFIESERYSTEKNNYQEIEDKLREKL